MSIISNVTWPVRAGPPETFAVTVSVRVTGRPCGAAAGAVRLDVVPVSTVQSSTTSPSPRSELVSYVVLLSIPHDRPPAAPPPPPPPYDPVPPACPPPRSAPFHPAPPPPPPPAKLNPGASEPSSPWWTLLLPAMLPDPADPAAGPE